MTSAAAPITLPCCNLLEPSGDPCQGSMTRHWPEYVCDTCKGRCGALVHPYCGQRVRPKP